MAFFSLLVFWVEVKDQWIYDQECVLLNSSAFYLGIGFKFKNDLCYQLSYVVSYGRIVVEALVAYEDSYYFQQTTYFVGVVTDEVSLYQ